MADVCAAKAAGCVDELPIRSAKKPRRIENRTVLIVRDGNHTALHKRPDRGLLAGLYELPNVEGHLDEGELLACIRSIGFDPIRVERLDDAKHIFSHIEWHMIGYRVTITPEYDNKRGRGGVFLVEDRVLREEYAIPSAFSAYTKYLH